MGTGAGFYTNKVTYRDKTRWKSRTTLGQHHGRNTAPVEMVVRTSITLENLRVPSALLRT